MKYSNDVVVYIPLHLVCASSPHYFIHRMNIHP